jgi:hypothetical protein
MERDQFVKCVLGRNVSIMQHRNKYNCPWDVREEYAALTQFISFECDFKGDLCAKYRHDSCTVKDIEYYRKALKTCKDPGERILLESRITRRQMCCCSICRTSVGHFNHINMSDIDMLASRFDPDIGFWRKGKGCVLPRAKRSTVCLGFMCSDVYGDGPNVATVLKRILHTPWKHGAPRQDPPKFISPYGRKSTQKWPSPAEMKEMLLKEKEKNGIKGSTKRSRS